MTTLSASLPLIAGSTAKVSFTASANTTGSSRSWSYEVSGPVTTTITVTQPAQSGGGSGKPNFQFYKPEGWPASAFTTTSDTSTKKVTQFTKGATVYVRYAICNNGTAAAARGEDVVVTIDGSSSTTLTGSSGLGVGKGRNPYVRFDTASMSAGTHTVKISINPSKTIAESSYTDNEQTLTFTIVDGSGSGKPNFQFYNPEGWPASAFTTTSDTSTKKVTQFTKGATVYLRYTVVNVGTAASSGSLDVSVSLDGAMGKTVTISDPLGIGAGKYMSGTIGTGSMSAGTHTVKISINPSKTIAESSYTDNEQTLTFTIVDGGDVSVKTVFPSLNTSGYTLAAGVGLAAGDCFFGTASGWTVTATGLPDGMLYNAGKRQLVGVPKKPGTYTVTLKAVKDGKTVKTSFALVVPAPPVTLVGTFMGFASADCRWVDEHYMGDPSCFGTMPSAMLYPFRMTVAESGTISATMGTTAFTADRWTSALDGIYSATLKTSSGAKMTVEVEPLGGWVNVTSFGDYTTKKAQILLFAYRNPYKKDGTAWENSKAGAVVEKLTKLGTCKLAVKKLKNSYFDLVKTTAASPALTVKVSNKGGVVIAGTLASEAISGSAIVRTQKLANGTQDYTASALITTASGRKWLIELDFGTGVTPTGKATIVK